MNIQTGDIIFFEYGPKSPILPKIIAWYQRLQYYHVGMMLSPYLLIESTFNKGVTISSLEQKEDEIKKQRLKSYIIKRHKYITPEHQKQLYDLAIDYVGSKYDKISLFLNFILARPITDDPNAFFCSEFVLTLYNRVNLPIINRRPQITTPAELFISPLLHIIENT